jgi:hypothetical protein
MIRAFANFTHVKQSMSHQRTQYAVIPDSHMAFYTAALFLTDGAKVTQSTTPTNSDRLPGYRMNLVEGIEANLISIEYHRSCFAEDLSSAIKWPDRLMIIPLGRMLKSRFQHVPLLASHNILRSMSVDPKAHTLSKWREPADVSTYSA